MLAVTISICYHWTPVINWCRRVPGGNYMMTETERKLSFTNTSSHPALHTNTDIISHLLLLSDTEQHGAENCYGNPREEIPSGHTTSSVIISSGGQQDSDLLRWGWRKKTMKTKRAPEWVAALQLIIKVLHLFTKITRQVTGATGLEPNHLWHLTERLSGDCSDLVTRNTSSPLPYCVLSSLLIIITV